VQRHGISRQLQRAASGSTPRDHATILQIYSSCSSPIDRPRQSAFRYPPAVDNLRRSTPHTAHLSAASPSHSLWDQLDPNHPAHPRRSNSHSARGTTYVPLSAVSFLGGFRTPAAELAALALKRPASETLHRSGQPKFDRGAAQLDHKIKSRNGLCAFTYRASQARHESSAIASMLRVDAREPCGVP
jgi:hypothetical protein